MVKFYEQICEQDRLNYIKDLKRSIDFNTYPKMLEFMQNETDNLDPEGLDMLKLTNNNSTTLIINPYLKKEVYKKHKYNF